MSFSCPLVEYYYRREWVKITTGVTSPRSSVVNFPVDLAGKPIMDVLLAILGEFEISLFREYYSSGSGGVMKEALWQHHFFHSCWKFFPKRIHPEVGACFKTRGSKIYFSTSLTICRFIGFLS